MFKKELTFTDYNGVQKTKTYYFNINRNEMVDLEIHTPQGYEDKVRALLKENDRIKIYEFFKDFIKLTYGVKTEDGMGFIKNEEEYQKFVYSPAYDQLIVDFLQHPETIEGFIEGVMPDMTKEQAAEYEKQKTALISEFTQKDNANVQH